VSENPKRSLTQTIAYQLRELANIFFYLAFFFCAIETYRTLLLKQFEVSYFDYGAALINALVIGKVILIGQDLHLGKKHESKPMFVSVIYKAFLFGLLVFVFRVLEEVIKRLIHGEPLAGAFHDVQVNDLLGRCVIIFGTFIPLFGFLEFRRVLGEDKFHDLLFQAGATGGSRA
jgi:hypothetical protein